MTYTTEDPRSTWPDSWTPQVRDLVTGRLAANGYNAVAVGTLLHFGVGNATIVDAGGIEYVVPMTSIGFPSMEQRLAYRHAVQAREDSWASGLRRDARRAGEYARGIKPPATLRDVRTVKYFLARVQGDGSWVYLNTSKTENRELAEDWLKLVTQPPPDISRGERIVIMEETAVTTTKPVGDW
jgi:hypothetical protein